MVAFSSLVFVISAIAGSLASPTDFIERDAEERSPANFVLGRDNAVSGLSRRQATNFNQDYTTGGTVSYSPSGNSFSVTWNTQNDFVVGVGWSPGSTA